MSLYKAVQENERVIGIYFFDPNQFGVDNFGFKKTEDDACPFNSLYWHFLDDKRAYFENNQRMRMMLSLFDKMD